ncbi:MAG: diphthine synthase, partial [Candidatus Woesearchaeota archaeon]|nr:diphthine synthase [Candidatus Woesearchaeota archaeon]
SVKGLEIVQKADKVYLESFTSTLGVSVSKLEKFYGKKVIEASRDMIENGQGKILEEAKKNNVAVLIVGDVFSATTHHTFLGEAAKAGVKVEVVYNASILTAVGVVGLQLYKYGKVTSIPFDNSNVEEPLKVLEQNQKMGLHTLFLLDLDPLKKKYMTLHEALEFLMTKGLAKDTLCVGCARLGQKDFKIVKGKASELVTAKFGKPPYCLIIPGKMHFMEEEGLSLWQQ